MLLLALGIAASTRMKFDPARHRVLVAELERLKAGGRGEDATEEAILVCETLAGLPCGRLMAGAGAQR